MNLPPFIQEKTWIVQTTDPLRRPREYAPPRLIDAFEVVRLMHWDSLDEIDSAKPLGFPDPDHFKNKVVNGAVVSRIGQYREDKVQEWRQRLAALIFATLK